MGLSHLLLEDTLERRKDMLDVIPIIRHIPPPATKIIKIYSKFPKTPLATPNQGYSLPLPTQNCENPEEVVLS